jgi:hypothetical protein
VAVSDLVPTRFRTRLPCWRSPATLLALAFVWSGWLTPSLQAQQWRSRVSTRVQYVEGQTLIRDSVLSTEVGDTPATCATGAEYCYFYRAGAVQATYPAVLDVDLSVFGFGLDGFRVYVSTLFRADMGGDEFWPRVNDNFDLLAAYLELTRDWFRVRVGREYQVSGLGFYGYDGGSAMFRYRPWHVEVEAYGGWGLARGVPEPINGDAFASLGSFQPTKRDLLFGIRGSARPTVNSSLEAIYQREIPTDRSGISTERLGFEGTYNPTRALSLSGHADYDLTVGKWGKAGLTVGYWAHRMIYLEGGLLRYRPVFSLQTIWVAFSPVAYNGWNLSVGLQPHPDLFLRLWGERRQYEDTEAQVPFFETTDRDWRVGGTVAWRPNAWGKNWEIDGGYWINWGFGSALNSGNLRIGLRPNERLSLGLRLSAFQQLEEFRVGEGRIWGLGGDVRWRTRAGTVWMSVDRYDHDRRINGDIADDPNQPDWTQWRAAFGLSYYLGSEPGRAP